MFQCCVRGSQATRQRLPTDLCEGQGDHGPGHLPGGGLPAPAGGGGGEHGQTSPRYATDTVTIN